MPPSLKSNREKNSTSGNLSARFVGKQNPRQNTPGRAREGVNLLDFQSRPTTCASERLLVLWASKSLCDRPSEIEDFGWSPRVLIFSERGLAPSEKKSLPCRFRARKSEGFQRNLRKGGAEGNPSPPRPRESSRGPQSSRISIKSISAGNRILFRGGGSGGGACSPVHLTRARAL